MIEGPFRDVETRVCLLSDRGRRMVFCSTLEPVGMDLGDILRVEARKPAD